MSLRASLARIVGEAGVCDALEGMEALKALGQECVERDIKEEGYPIYQAPEIMGPPGLTTTSFCVG